MMGKLSHFCQKHLDLFESMNFWADKEVGFHYILFTLLNPILQHSLDKSYENRHEISAWTGKSWCYADAVCCLASAAAWSSLATASPNRFEKLLWSFFCLAQLINGVQLTSYTAKDYETYGSQAFAACFIISATIATFDFIWKYRPNNNSSLYMLFKENELIDNSFKLLDDKNVDLYKLITTWVATAAMIMVCDAKSQAASQIVQYIASLMIFTTWLIDAYKKCYPAEQNCCDLTSNGFRCFSSAV